jgi:rRNA maturation RNase YbeY
MTKAAAIRRLKSLENLLFKKLKIKNSRLELSLLSNREMDAVRENLALRPDFKGPEARKIKEEEYVSVLAFPETRGFPHPEDRRQKLGEIYLNYEFAKGDLDVLRYLFIHGLLHLLGFKHLRERDRIHMEKLEKKLFIQAISREK